MFISDNVVKININNFEEIQIISIIVNTSNKVYAFTNYVTYYIVVCIFSIFQWNKNVVKNVST